MSPYKLVLYKMKLRIAEVLFHLGLHYAAAAGDDELHVCHSTSLGEIDSSCCHTH